MGIGGSIALLALGAILTFALDVQVGWLDLDAVGWILMAAGAAGLILTMTIWNSRRTTRSTVVRTPAAPVVPTVQRPVVPTVQEPVVPTVQEPVVREPVVREPVVQEPVVRESVVTEPLAGRPEETTRPL